jgi:hypothetical protein
VKIDLHVHSTYSDGTFDPKDVVDSAIELGLTTIAITDHDNVLGYYSAKKYIEENGKDLNVIPGIEINTFHKKQEVHVLGYFMDLENPTFLAMIEKQQKARRSQAKEISKRLQKIGINVAYEDIKKCTIENSSIGRPHIAKAISQKGGTSSVTEAYSKYINDSSSVYVQRKTVTPHEAVEIIYDAGGIPVIAHPCDIENAQELIEELMSYGLRGVEAYHRKHTPAIIEYFCSLAEQYDLVVTGGSDFHSPSLYTGQVIMGKNFVPPKILEELELERKRIEIANS